MIEIYFDDEHVVYYKEYDTSMSVTVSASDLCKNTLLESICSEKQSLNKTGSPLHQKQNIFNAARCLETAFFYALTFYVLMLYLYFNFNLNTRHQLNVTLSQCVYFNSYRLMMGTVGGRNM
jgi:hypothetical protein